MDRGVTHRNCNGTGQVRTSIVAVVGSGGKTTYIREQAKKYRAEGKRVLVTTTTHMFAETDTLFTNDAAEICACLEQTGYCMAGQRAERSSESDGQDISLQSKMPDVCMREKIRGLSPEMFKRAAQEADVVLVEADGSKGKPVKFPAAHEPVIPDGTDVIVIVMGFFAIGQTIAQACHRPDLVCRCLGVGDEHRLTAADLERIIDEGYRKPLTQQYPGVTIICKKSL